MTNKFDKTKHTDSTKDSKKTNTAFGNIKNAFDSTVTGDFNKCSYTGKEDSHGTTEDGGQHKRTETKNLFENLTQNINNTFKHNLTLGQSCLQCKTATDFADIQRKFFEYNYKNMIKTYSDLMQDMQQMTTQTGQNTTTSCTSKGN
ncbi:MAG: hypothetical protein EKK61_04310 [Rickettsiales bacterium]|nr:MAG: hypothetical protein EKK61_04310 [Rickettsiales bacterium]